MPEKQTLTILTGKILEEDQLFSLADLCRYCSLSAEQVINMVDFGLIKPMMPQQTYSCWQFSGSSVIRVQKALRLQKDLGVNLAGSALALELLDEIRELRRMVEYLQRD